jgi:glycosyltransferase involved in cell wall biosynthesis
VILFILPCFSGGGAERVSLTLLKGLYEKGYSVGLIVFDQNGPLSSIVPDGVPIYNLGTIALRRSIVPLIKKIQQLKPKVIFSTFGYINVALLAIRWILKLKIKLLVREANLPSISLPNNSWEKLMTASYRLLYPKADKLICTSIRMVDEFTSTFSVPESIIELLPNPIDVDAIRELSMPIKCFDKAGVRYVASGRLTFQKGFDRLLYWFSELNDEKSTLVILGDGNDKSALIQQAKDLNIQNQVKFLGFCDNPWQWYAGADVTLISSRWEGMPNVALESLACGTPVISTIESGGVAEIARQVRNNELIVVSSHTSFIDEMLKIKPNSTKTTKVSLLPEIYHAKSSISAFEKLINL